MPELTHIDGRGNPAMVDVSVKQTTQRTATAQSIVELGEEIMAELKEGEIFTKKGPVFHTAIIAGTMGAKKTSELIPFCHPVGLEDCKIEITTEGTKAIIRCTAKVTAKTGIEMEAITGASVAAITMYDMCKAMSHDIEIVSTRLLEKTGGKKDFKFI
ncbi:MAG: cyclic pyranopterin monophosphate synthase MoaC [Cyclobacteriaceae bacterium]|nr:cyclic pyranopterin monophosphate synthase MoaC [Cyclobacteriaceae bacterium]